MGGAGGGVLQHLRKYLENVEAAMALMSPFQAWFLNCPDIASTVGRRSRCTRTFVLVSLYTVRKRLLVLGLSTSKEALAAARGSR